jgi:hypothetical protein
MAGLRRRLEKLETRQESDPGPELSEEEALRVVCGGCLNAPADEWCAVTNGKSDPREFLRRYGDAKTKRLCLGED